MPVKKAASKTVHKKKPLRRASRARNKTKSLFPFNRSSVKSSFLLIALFCLSLTFLFSMSLYKKLNMSFASADSRESFDIKSRDIMSVAVLKVTNFENSPVLIEEAFVYIVDFSDRKLLKVTIPGDLEVDVAGKFGFEPVYKLFALSSSLHEEDKPKTFEMIKTTLSNSILFPIDRILLVQLDSKIGQKELFSNNGASIIDSLVMVNSEDAISTDLSLNEYYYLTTFTKSLEQKDLLLNSMGLIESQNHSSLSALFRDLTFDSFLAMENLSISVLNGTSTSGVASKFATIAENVGGRVVNSENSTNKYEQTYVVTEYKDSYTTRVLLNVLGVESAISKQDFYKISSEYQFESRVERSDITVIIGVDTVRRL